ncbi:MAG TPA: hypothetical protein VFG66_00665 [Gemmatimonadales bacterium]|nr:hypothetical protein [Gemmatimonadales bacterium]
MFLGHYGAALALKRAEPKVSLGTLFVATQLLDLLWGAFLLLGWEHVRILPDANPLLTFQFYDYPISHSLVAAVAWGLAAAALYYSWPTRDVTRHWQAAALVGAAVFSHWLLDLLVHVPDLPLAGNDSAKVGLGLWRHLGLSVGVELIVLALGIAVYVARRSRRHPVRPMRLAFVVLLLLATYVASLLAPSPPSIPAVAVADIVFILVLGLLAGWADRAATPAELAAGSRTTR